MFTHFDNYKILLFIACSFSWIISSDSPSRQQYFINSYNFNKKTENWDLISHPVMLDQENLENILKWLLPRYEKKYDKIDEKTCAKEPMYKILLQDSAKNPLKTIYTNAPGMIEDFVMMH